MCCTTWADRPHSAPREAEATVLQGLSLFQGDCETQALLLLCKMNVAETSTVHFAL